MKDKTKRFFKILAITEITLGLFLLIRELVSIYSFWSLLHNNPLKDIVCQGGISFDYIFLCVVAIITGISY